MKDLKIYQKYYDMLIYLHIALRQFPKSEKFTLASEIKRVAIDGFRLIIRANKNNEIKLEKLQKSIYSFLGLCKHCQSYHSRKNVFNQINKSINDG